MPLAHEHDLHSRRFSRNAGVGIALAVFVVLIFLLSVVKVSLLEVPTPAQPPAVVEGG